MNFLKNIFIQISLYFVLKGTIDKESTWFQVMAWCLTGKKPLPEPMMANFYDPSPGLNELMIDYLTWAAQR